MSLDFQLVLSGLGTAGAVALLALGLVVTYKGSGVLNFAHGAYATAAVYTYVWLVDIGFGVIAAAVGGLAATVAIAALVEVLVMRRLADAPMLAKVVATLGVMLTIQACVSVLTGGATPNPHPLLPAATLRFSLGGADYTLAGDRLIILSLVVAVSLGVAALYRWSRFGAVTRAVADDQDAVRLTGTSPSLVALANSCFGALLAGAAGLLLAGFAPISPTFFTSVLITAIAATLVGGFRSVLVTVAAAIAIGLAQAVIVRHTSSWEATVGLVGWAEAIPVVLILLVVLVRGRALPVRDTLTRLGLPRVPVVRRPWLVAGCVLAGGALWFFALPTDWADPMAMSLISTLVCLSLVVLLGYGGQISLGQMAFAGLAALVTARAAAGWGLAFPWAGAVGVVVAILAGLLFALPALRVRGVELAVVTLGAALVLELMVFNSPRLNGSGDGSTVPSPSLGSLDLDSITNPAGFGLMVTIVVSVAVWLVTRLRKSGLGRRMLAVRENEQGSASSGVSVVRTKIAAFAISGALAGTAGALFAYRSGVVTFDSFVIVQSVFFVAIVYLGGVGSVVGALVVGIFFAPGGVGNQISSVIWHDGWMQVIAGVVLLQVVVAHPNGLAGIPRQIKAARNRRRRQATAEEEPPPPVAAPVAGSLRGDGWRRFPLICWSARYYFGVTKRSSAGAGGWWH